MSLISKRWKFLSQLSHAQICSKVTIWLLIWGCCWPHCPPKWLELKTQTSPVELVISSENQHFLSVAWTKFVYSCEDQSVRHIINIPRSPKSQQILRINQWERRKQGNGPITDLETVNSLFSSRCWCLLLSPIVT